MSPTDDAYHLGEVHLVSLEAFDASDDTKGFFQEFNKCAERLQAQKMRQIDPKTEPPMPKIIWKIEAIFQSVIYRSVELHNAISVLLNANNLLGAIIVSRTLIELMVFVADLYQKLVEGVEQRDLGKIDAATMATNFATRWDSMPEETKAVNILTIIKKFDKGFMGSKDETPTADVHATLSEYTHPNWVGMAGYFGKINYETRVHYLSVHRENTAKLHDTLAAGCIGLGVIDYLLRKITALKPAIEQISLENLDKLIADLDAAEVPET
jgi:hypothetical protein